VGNDEDETERKVERRKGREGTRRDEKER